MISSEQAGSIGLAIAGDTKAFDRIVQEYQARIARYLLRLVRDPELALDLTQDTFVHAFRHIRSLRSAEALSAWLYRIATNLAIQSRSRGLRLICQPLSDSTEGILAESDAPDQIVINRDMVGHALAGLPRERAACLLLHVHEGFSYEEVAVIVNSTPEAVRKRISRAKQQFRQIYDAACEETAQYAVR